MSSVMLSRARRNIRKPNIIVMPRPVGEWMSLMLSSDVCYFAKVNFEPLVFSVAYGKLIQENIKMTNWGIFGVKMTAKCTNRIYSDFLVLVIKNFVNN